MAWDVVPTQESDWALMGGPGGAGATGGRVKTGPGGGQAPSTALPPSDELPPALRETQRTRDQAQGIPDEVTDLPSASKILGQRIRQAEGTANQPWLMYGSRPFKPGDEHPGAAARVMGPHGPTSASGPYQWEEDTWNRLKTDFRARYGRDPKFSADADQDAMMWLNAGKHYKGGEKQLIADIEAGKLDTAQLVGEWEGFKNPSGSGPWAVTERGQWKLNPGAIAREQSRGDTRVVYMSPDDYLSMFPASKSAEKRKSLLQSLGLGEPIQEIPSLDVRQDGGRAKVIDQDGAHRARVAKENGVDAIPVAVHGVKGDVAWLEDMNGATRRFNYDQVPATKAPRPIDPYSGTPQPEQRPGMIGRIIDAAGRGRERGYGDAPLGQGSAIGQGLPGAAGEIADLVARDIGAGIGAVTGGAAQAYREVMPGWAQHLPSFTEQQAQNPLDIPQAIENAPEIAQAVIPPFMPGPGLPGAARGVPRELPPGTNATPNQMLRAVKKSTEELNKAIKLINERAAETEKAKPGSQAEAVTVLEAGRNAGEPIVPLDVVGEEVQGLAGRAARFPGGAGRQIASDFAESRRGTVSRESPIAQSLERSIGDTLGTQSAKAETKHVLDQRSGPENRRLWAKAEHAADAQPKVSEKLARDYANAQRKAEASATDVKQAEKWTAALERDAAQQNVRVPRKPVRLSDWLVRGGGLQDDGGEIAHIVGGRKVLKRNKGARNSEADKLQHRLIKADGQTLDDAANEAWEHGYIQTAERPTIAEFLDKLAQDINGREVYSDRDTEIVAEYERARAQNAEAARNREDRPLPKGRRVSFDEVADARDRVDELKARAARDQEIVDELAEAINAGQADGTALLPGAVTSPTLRRLSQGEWIKKGLNRGAFLAREEAIADGTRFNPKDFAVIGQDAEGRPVVGEVPTMRAWMKAKEGLDAIIAEERTNFGRLTDNGRIALKQRNALLKELDSINPDYKPARDYWGGHTAMARAIQDGQDMAAGGKAWKVENVVERMKNATEIEKRLIRIGYADTLKNDIREAVLNGDPSKKVINSTADRDRLEAVAGGKAAAEKMVAAVERARKQFETPNKLLGNSATAARHAEDLAEARAAEDSKRLVTGLAKGAMGHPVGALWDLARANEHRLTRRPAADPRVLGQVLRLLTDPKTQLNRTGDLISALPVPAVPSNVNLARQALPGPVMNTMAGALRGGGMPGREDLQLPWPGRSELRDFGRFLIRR